MNKYLTHELMNSFNFIKLSKITVLQNKILFHVSEILIENKFRSFYKLISIK